MTRFAVPPLLAVVAALAVAASVGATTRPQTEASYRAAAGDVCTKAAANLHTAINDAVRRYGNTPHAVAAALEASLMIGRSRYSSLKALDPPTSMRPLHLKALSLFSRGLDVIAGVVADVKGGADPSKELKKLDPTIPLGQQESAVWRQLGVKACQ